MVVALAKSWQSNLIYKRRTIIFWRGWRWKILKNIVYNSKNAQINFLQIIHKKIISMKMQPEKMFAQTTTQKKKSLTWKKSHLSSEAVYSLSTWSDKILCNLSFQKHHVKKPLRASFRASASPVAQSNSFGWQFFLHKTTQFLACLAGNRTWPFFSVEKFC